MKIGLMSDTHGGLESTIKALEILKDCDSIIHLGDVLYHGPRNELPVDYNPKELAELLKNIENIEYIRGNCDSDVDQMVTEKDLTMKNRLFKYDDLLIYAVHGYEESEHQRLVKAKKLGAKIIVTGHTHIKKLEVKDSILMVNPGSTTIPKDGSKSVAIIDDNKVTTIDIDNNKVLSILNF